MNPRPAALALALIIAACAANQISGTVLASYDSAVAVEVIALKSGKITPAEATKLEGLRLKAWVAVQAVVSAEQSGGTASASLANAATAAIAALSTEANLFKGS